MSTGARTPPVRAARRRSGDAPVNELVEAARAGDARAVARLLSLVEDASPRLREAMAALHPHAGAAAIIGVTGAPGVGKSTCTNGLVAAYRARGMRVGVLAVDPSSPFSGGALLGDRVRMQDHTLDAKVFVRSMATRGHLGGLAWATPQAVRVLAAAGCEVIIVETVGVGQSEVDIAGLADTTIVLLAPGMGDGVQVAKAGILEVGDLYVVNKADRDGADQVRRDLQHMLALGGQAAGERLPPEGKLWRPPVLTSVASTGQGLDEVVDAVDRHRAHLTETGKLNRLRDARVRAEIESIVVTAVRARMGAIDSGALLDSLAGKVMAGDLDPYAAADELLAALSADPALAADAST